MKTNWLKEYNITSVCKDDLLSAGFSRRQVNSLDDADMKHLASKMADAYCENGFWIDLKIILQNILDDKKTKRHTCKELEQECDFADKLGNCLQPQIALDFECDKKIKKMQGENENDRKKE